MFNTSNCIFNEIRYIVLCFEQFPIFYCVERKHLLLFVDGSVFIYEWFKSGVGYYGEMLLILQEVMDSNTYKISVILF
ncbi:hypothetical protein RJT34_16829 [Clitoria ternatea]|uniref:Uncharacterized protein n=1 Tax=Clitoria ternatea TaxID=43366 RepID=A0AAN9J836_CLITE